MISGNLGGVPDGELLHLAIGAPIPLGLVSLAQPRQHESGWVTIVIEDGVARDEGTQDGGTRMADTGDELAMVAIAPEAVAAEPATRLFGEAHHHAHQAALAFRSIRRGHADAATPRRGRAVCSIQSRRCRPQDF